MLREALQELSEDLEELEVDASHEEELQAIADILFPELGDVCKYVWVMELVLEVCKRRQKNAG